jgi:hypothetical protein
MRSSTGSTTARKPRKTEPSQQADREAGALHRWCLRIDGCIERNRTVPDNTGKKPNLTRLPSPSDSYGESPLEVALSCSADSASDDGSDERGHGAQPLRASRVIRGARARRAPPAFEEAG